MITRFLKRKRLLVGLGVVATLVVAGSAFAYFTSTGTGTGSATVGSTAPALSGLGVGHDPLHGHKRR